MYRFKINQKSNLIIDFKRNKLRLPCVLMINDCDLEAFKGYLLSISIKNYTYEKCIEKKKPIKKEEIKEVTKKKEKK